MAAASAPPAIVWGKAGQGSWQKIGDACNVCGPDGCDHTHPPTGLEQSLDEMEFTRSACSAAQAGDIDKLQRCLDRNPGAVYHDGVADGRSGYTPLHYAARSGHADCVALLLRAEPTTVHARTVAGGATPLMRAAFAGHGRVCTLLVRAGAVIAAQDADGESALHKAAQQQHRDVLAVLERACPEATELVNRRGLRAREMLRADDGA